MAQEKQRIIEYTWLDLNNALAHGQEDAGTIIQEGYVFDSLFRKRLFVLTNHGIHILREIETEIQCENCPPYNFCPRGPYSEFTVKLTDILAIVNVPNCPSKLIIRYTKQSHLIGQDSRQQKS